MISAFSQKTKYLITAVFITAFLVVSLYNDIDSIPDIKPISQPECSISTQSHAYINVLAETRTEVSLIKESFYRNINSRNASATRRFLVGLLIMLTTALLFLYLKYCISFQNAVYTGNRFIILFIHNQDGLKD